MDPDRDPGLGAPSEAEPEFDFVRAGLFFYGTMAIVAVLWRVGFYRESILFASSDAESSGIELGRNLLVGLAAGSGVVVLSYVCTKRTQWGDALARAMGEALGSVSVPNAVLLAFASGLAEEMFFRGALQPRAGLVIASLIFGAIHFVPRRIFYPWTAFAIVVGFLFGALFEWTGNLIAPVIAHTFVNAVNLPLLVKQYGGNRSA